MKHKHHIIPRHMGGSNDPSNLIEVSVEEHAELHFALYLDNGHWQDWVACQALSGQATHQEATLEAIRQSSRQTCIKRNRENNPMKNPESARKAGEGCKKWWAKHPEARAKRAEASRIINTGRKMTDEQKAKHQEKINQRWEDESQHQQHSEIIKATWTEERKQKQRVGVSKSWTPERRRKHSETCRKTRERKQMENN